MRSPREWLKRLLRIRKLASIGTIGGCIHKLASKTVATVSNRPKLSQMVHISQKRMHTRSVERAQERETMNQ